MSGIIELIQSLILIIAAVMMFIAGIGLLRFDKNLDNVVYARIHVFGMFDIALIFAFIGLGEILLAGIYFLIAPIIAHAMGNAYYHGEDKLNNKNIKDNKDLNNESPFLHPISKFKNSKNENRYDMSSENVTISKLDIKEDE